MHLIKSVHDDIAGLGALVWARRTSSAVDGAAAVAGTLYGSIAHIRTTDLERDAGKRISSSSRPASRLIRGHSSKRVRRSST